jgi:L-malate glycosyltransferase
MALRVLMLPSFYPTRERPAAGIFFRDQAIALRRSGTDVDVAYVESRSLRQVSLSGVRENHFQITANSEEGLLTLRQRAWNPLLRTQRGGIVWAWLMRRLVRRYVTRSGKPDVIHAHNALWAGYAAYLIQREHGIPYVLTEHDSLLIAGPVPAAAAKYLARIYSGAGAVLAVSKRLAGSMATYLGGAEALVVPNVVHTDFFQLPPRPPASEPYTFLAIAHLIEAKGLHILIRAFARAFPQGSNVRLKIGGDGPERRRLEALCTSLGIEQRVTLLGGLSREQVRENMWSANSFVLPSFFETFGVVLIEALSTGLPVIATRCNGPEEIVSPEVGMLVPPRDEQQLAWALKEMYQHDGYSRTALREYARCHYGEEAFTDALNSIYAGVVAGAGPAKAASVPTATVN